ncbi:MAG TPA: hypothetical protein VHT24_04040, partial [Pseudacidobacterium sp.]|nr:hypothetical protein [Pseudacidobacterium sp.]
RGLSMATNQVSGQIQPLKPKKTFAQRLGSTTLWWGIPAVCVELFGIPRTLWPYVLIYVLPATAVGVITGAAIEHAAARRRSKSEG